MEFSNVPCLSKVHNEINTVHVLISDVGLRLSALSASLQMMASWVGQLICMSEGMPVREALIGLSSGSMQISWSSTSHAQGPAPGLRLSCNRLEHQLNKDIPVRKEMRIMMGKKLNIKFSCGQKVNYIIHCVKEVWSAGRERWFSPLSSALVRMHLQQCIELGPSQWKIWTCLSRYRWGRWKWSEGCSISPMKIGWEFQPREKKALETP